MNSFLNYSINNDKSIKAIIMLDDKIIQKNIKIKSINENGFYYTTSGKKKEEFLSHDKLLSATYARGDEEGK